MDQPKPTVGRIVHYVLPEGRNAGEHRPAIVTRVWSDVCVQLQVFTDGENDGLANVEWRTSILNDEAGAPNTWHWPERG